ncbi:peptidase C39 [Stieleria sp. TO1_6]|uniref:peptidase C39 n=1 Tax=Stieleria tagensis TaxID=2956795 RepID=UPI00209AED71|nr:peptidase C39 [Stieleria tagensis]MCO8122917.1 peptidase C39 [Stieleria tagensis]
MDLWIAIGFIASFSGLSFIAGRRLSLSVYRDRPALFVECLLLSLVFAFGLSGRLLWASALPTAAVVCWSNWLPILLAFAAGLASNASALRQLSRSIAVTSMLLLSAGFLILPVLRPSLFPIEIANTADWQDGVCLQSNEASCGPAAAATLLRQSGLLAPLPLRHQAGHWDPTPLDSSETWLAGACLTSRHGTSSLGLIRGLRMAVNGSDRQVQVADSDPGRWSINGQLPNLAVVRFRNHRAAGPVTQLLGTDAEGHAIVVHSRTSDGRWRIADPAVGWRMWSDEELRRVFTGEAIYLGNHSE